MLCRVCGTKLTEPIFVGKPLGYNVEYYDCSSCGYVQTEDPWWLDEAYSSAINASDTGILARNQSNLKLVLATLHSLGRKKGVVVDYAGGYGFLVRMLRDAGVNAFWQDLHSENLVARGFEYQGGKADLVTAFELFEHLVTPFDDLRSLFFISPNVLLTTNLIPEPAPSPKKWWYYGLEHGQHTGFFRVKTLRYLAQRFDKRLISDGKSTHLFSEKNISLKSWEVSRKVARYAPWLFRRGLHSKTWADHEKMLSSHHD